MAEMDAFERSLAGAFVRLVDDVPSEVDGLAVAHRVALEHPRRRVRALSWGPVAVPRLAWLLLLVGLLLVTVAGVLLVGSGLLGRLPWFERDPSALAPSGIELMSPDAGSYGTVVADGDGNLWAPGGGRLVRYTPATGAARTWTVADDLRFDDIGSLTPARAGGVWLVGQRSMRRFDGEAFRESVDIEADVGTYVAAAVEAPDRSLWAATSDGGVVHVVGATTSRISVPQVATESYIASIAVDDAGRLWCGWAIGSEEAVESEWVSRYDGSTWVTFDATAAAPLEGSIFSLTALPDGSVVAATSRGVARFDGSTWTDLTATAPAPAPPASAATIAPDGSLWTGWTDPTDGTVTVRHLAGGSWTLFGPEQGLPGAGSLAADPSLVATNDGVFVGTGAGIFRLDAARWQRAWPTAGTPSPASIRSVAAASRDEAWAWNSEGGLWHLTNGSWTAQPTPYTDDIGELDGVLRSPDGTIWVTVSAGNSGVDTCYRLQGGQWVRVAIAPSALGADDSGSVWVAGYDAASPAGIVVRSYALDGDTWIERSSTTSTSLVSGRLTGVAVGGDGSVWLASSASWGWMIPAKAAGPGLARYRGGSWESVSLPGMPPDLVVRGLASTRDGSVWAIGGSADGTWVARFDGSGWRICYAIDGLRYASSVAAAPDGTVWVTTPEGLARFDGSAWTTVVRGLWFEDVDVAPDGTVWVTGDFGVARLASSLTGQ